MFWDCASYYGALTKQSTFDQSSFTINVKESLQRPCPKVSYENYCAEYQSKKICGRKIFAIPLAIYALVFKTIYHLGCAILLGLGEALRCKGKSFKENIFKCSCDFEESIGYLVALVNDKKGTYFIQESAFKKACYTYANGNSREPLPQQLRKVQCLAPQCSAPSASAIPKEEMRINCVKEKIFAIERRLVSSIKPHTGPAHLEQYGGSSTKTPRDSKATLKSRLKKSMTMNPSGTKKKVRFSFD